MKKIFIAVVAVAAAASMTACGTSQEASHSPATHDPAPATPEVVKYRCDGFTGTATKTGPTWTVKDDGEGEIAMPISGDLDQWLKTVGCTR